MVKRTDVEIIAENERLLLQCVACKRILKAYALAAAYDESELNRDIHTTANDHECAGVPVSRSEFEASLCAARINQNQLAPPAGTSS